MVVVIFFLGVFEEVLGDRGFLGGDGGGSRFEVGAGVDTFEVVRFFMMGISGVHNNNDKI